MVDELAESVKFVFVITSHALPDATVIVRVEVPRVRPRVLVLDELNLPQLQV